MQYRNTKRNDVRPGVRLCPLGTAFPLPKQGIKETALSHNS